MRALLAAALVLFSGMASAADGKSATEKSAGQTNLQLVEYFLTVPVADANPTLVEPFLAVDPASLPKTLRRKTEARQIEIRTLIKLHETKKKGSLIPTSEECTGKEMVLPLDRADFYASFGYEEVAEDELQYVMHKTQCTELDLGCRFSLKIFFKRKKPRRLMFYAADPIMALVAEYRGKAGSTKFFGIGLTCMH